MLWQRLQLRLLKRRWQPADVQHRPRRRARLCSAADSTPVEHHGTAGVSSDTCHLKGRAGAKLALSAMAVDALALLLLYFLILARLGFGLNP